MLPAEACLEVAVKLDAHVHTVHSGRSSIKPLDRIMRESYTTPQGVYALAKARGMDLVAITDHDRIDGALTIADRPDVIVGCEVTGTFPDGVRVHLNVLDITEAQFTEIDRLRRDVTELLPFLRHEGIFVSLNHVASRVNGLITAAHIAAILPWIDAFEVINGSRLRLQNRTAAGLADAHHKVGVAGSDAHTTRGIGRSWVEAPLARTREGFMRELRAGRVQVGGRHGNVFTMASDVLRMTARLYEEHGRHFLAAPLRWRRQLMTACLVVGVPLVMVPLVLSVLHFVLEARFNRSLLRDISQRPALRVPEWA
jgi:predicted metal-dependent phosphoesterase TrpH